MNIIKYFCVSVYITKIFCSFSIPCFVSEFYVKRGVKMKRVSKLGDRAFGNKLLFPIVDRYETNFGFIDCFSIDNTQI